MLGSSCAAAQLVASQEGLSSMSDWVIYCDTEFGFNITKILINKTVCCVSTSHSLLRASNSGDSSASVTNTLTKSSLHRLPYNSQCFSWLTPRLAAISHQPSHLFTSWHESESYVTTKGQLVSLSWNQAPVWGLRPDFYYRQTVMGLLMWGAFSDERTGLSFTIAAGPRQCSHSQVRVLWD
jgi:hypothetical protein